MKHTIPNIWRFHFSKLDEEGKNTPKVKEITEKQMQQEITALANMSEELRNHLDSMMPYLRGPQIDNFSPTKGYAGSVLEIQGRNFSATRTGNDVTVGGKPATVLKASSSMLTVLTDPLTITGPVKVQIGVRAATSAMNFEIVRYPRPNSRDDGPPILFSGKGIGSLGDVPSTGTLNVLVVLVNPTDRIPANPVATRNTVLNTWTDVHTFYDQASYQRLDVDVDVTANWHTLTGNFNDYVVTSGVWYAPNIRQNALGRLMAEAAQAAVDEGFSLDNYAVMVCVINLNGTFIRAWGGWSQSNFSYNDGAGTNINITANHDVSLVAICEVADWGRFAHELGHNIVSAPAGLSASPGAATLGEDVYSSDLIDPNIATAEDFEMMGNHDTHPLFSAYHMEKTGYYSANNILNLQWDRNSFKQEYEVVAHGTTENSYGARYHLIKICVTQGLYYYIEVRQRPPNPATQIFDPNIPIGTAPQKGGVVVTKVLTDTVNMNQQLRFITLLHDPIVLKQNDVATDPARALKITVINDHVVNTPLVCRVRVEWAQGIADDPNGAFDLRVDPWDNNWQTPDIWIDRIPYGAFDQARDAENRPLGNGDKPRPNEINKFYCRVHCDGSVATQNVRLTFYSVEPPGVGDNGNWAPLQTKVISNINANNFADVSVDWVPVVGRHTCLKAWAEQQLGEITGGDNAAQENVFDFEAPASSVPDPLIMPVAVRNPLKDPTLVMMSISGVPRGYTVQFPNAWLWLEPLQERKFELVIIPTLDYWEYRKADAPLRTNIRLKGNIPRSYKEKLEKTGYPASRMMPIGGITAAVTPKQRVTVTLEEDKEHSQSSIKLKGFITPKVKGESLRVDLLDPKSRQRSIEVKTNVYGAFSATFDLTQEPSLEANPKNITIEKPLGGTYRAQALVINSPNIAEAQSPFVYITR